MNKEQIAKSLHYMMSGFKVSIGEPPYPPWDALSDLRRQFFTDAIEFVNKDTTPEQVHDFWVEWTEKNEPGHASLIPFEDLSLTEKIKDDIVIVILNMFKKYE